MYIHMWQFMLTPQDQPVLAVGVLSHSAPKNAERRSAIRTSWVPAPRRALFHFVLRCGGLTANHIVRSESGVLCANEIPATEPRRRGTILTIMWWLEFALRAYPSVGFIAKADDDTFVALPSIVSQLEAIPSEAAPHSWYGMFGYIQLGLRPYRNNTQFSFYGWQEGRPRLPDNRPWVVRERRRLCGTATRGGQCFDPFPMALGPFYALGRGAVHALIGAPGLTAELAQLARLAADNPVFYDDQWLGYAYHRLVGTRSPMRLFALNPEWNRLYIDVRGSP